MSETASISTGIAARYATAIFELAKEDKSLPALESDVDALETAMADSDDLRALITSPVYSREAMGTAITAIAKKMGLSVTLTSTLGLMATKRRLFVSHAAILALARVLSLGKSNDRSRKTVARLLLRSLRPRAVYLIDESGSGQPLLCAARSLGIRVIGVQHGDVAHHHRE